MKTDKKQRQKKPVVERSSMELLAATAHDMKTPLVLMSGLSERLLRDDLNEEQQRQYLERINISSERLLQLVEALSGARRGGSREIELSPVNIRVVIEEVLAELQLHAEHRHIALQLIKGRSPVVLTNRVALYRILANLIDNAIKYSKPNSMVQVRTVRRGNSVTIMVRDNGAGVRKDDLDKIFSLFGTAVEPTNALPGSSGLGLFISRQLANFFLEKLSHLLIC